MVVQLMLVIDAVHFAVCSETVVGDFAGSRRIKHSVADVGVSGIFPETDISVPLDHLPGEN